MLIWFTGFLRQFCRQFLSIRLAGILYNFASCWAFYFATFFLHIGEQLYPSGSELYVFTRQGLGLAIVAPLYWRQLVKKRSGRFHTWLISRSLFNLLAVFAFYKSVEAGGAARANLLNMTYPLFVAICAGPLLGEFPDRRKILLMLFAFTGVWLVLERNGGVGGDSWIDLLPGLGAANLWGLASALFASLAVVSLRGATRHSSVVQIMFWLFLPGTLIFLPALFSVAQPLPAAIYPYLLLSALFGFAGQWLLTLSYNYLDANTGSIISTLRIPIAMLLGYFVLTENFGPLGWMGGSMILLTNILLAMQRRQTKRQEQTG